MPSIELFDLTATLLSMLRNERSKNQAIDIMLSIFYANLDTDWTIPSVSPMFMTLCTYIGSTQPYLHSHKHLKMLMKELTFRKFIINVYYVNREHDRFSLMLFVK